jgi:hypothetical protein
LLVHLLLNVSSGVWHLLVNHSKHGFWNLVWIVDLQECVFMTSSLLTHGAEVKVLADTTFVSDTDDWIYSTSITRDFLVDFVIRRFNLITTLSSELLAVNHVVEDLLALFVKFLLDEFLEAFSWKASKLFVLSFLLFTFAFLSNILSSRIFTHGLVKFSLVVNNFLDGFLHNAGVNLVFDVQFIKLLIEMLLQLFW